MRGKSTKLPVDEFVDAFWFTQDGGTVLDKGKVVHDYLK
jgi:acetoacetate decarboxylase